MIAIENNWDKEFDLLEQNNENKVFKIIDLINNDDLNNHILFAILPHYSMSLSLVCSLARNPSKPHSCQW